ncbi:MAG: hypothetical protein JWR80_2608 [Bradyrhizobium sp.]|nr:hypothetical protein [Bradyrhizobium sp.]
MKRQHTRLKEIEGGRIELAHLLDQRAMLNAGILQLEAAQEARIEDTILEAVRRWRIARLPIGEVLAVLEQLADTQNVPVMSAASAVAPAGLPSGDIEVVVKLSRNASVSNRRALAAAGLHWNGRVGRWIGKTSAETLESLHRGFGGRVEGTALATPAEEAGSERVDTPDCDASALGADLEAIATGEAAVAEPDSVEIPASIQAAATASLRVPVHSLRGLPRVRPTG